MSIKEDMKQRIYNVLKQYVNEKDIIIEIPKDKKMGDYAIPCFNYSKLMHKSPNDIALEIEKNIDKTNYKKIEIINGYVNITISDQLLNEKIIEMNDKPKFGIKNEKSELYFLDYGGPNIAKPLHVGHMRTAIVGESIKRIIEFMGNKTISDVHLGDYGLQIGEVIYGILRDNKNINEIDVSYLDKIYPEISNICKENENVKNECAAITKALQDGDKKYIELWNVIRKISSSDIKKNYDYLDVNFDLWEGESDCYKYLKIVEDMLNEKKLLKQSEGALVVEVMNDNDKKTIPPLLFKKSNGAYLYASTDVATIYERVTNYKPDHILYVVDNRQELHFEQVFRTCDKLDLIRYDSLEFLGYGTVNGNDGKPYKTRNGDTPKLENLFKQAKQNFIEKKETNINMIESDQDKIVNAILKFADLSNSRDRDYIFDLAKFSDVVGKTGPYILYTYLRINKMIKDYDIKKLSNTIYNDVDRDLRIKLLGLESTLQSAFNERKPHYIAEYLYDLCVLTNIFYQNNNLSNLKDDINKNDWIYVLNLTNRIIKQLLNLLIIDIPTIM